MTTSTKFGIPYIASQQATPEITHNEALYLIEALLRGVKDRTNTPPGAPADGDTYLVTAVATGAWAGWENHIAIYASNAWRFVPGYDTDGTRIAIGAAHEGMQVYVQDEDKLYRWTGAAWSTGTLSPSDVAFSATDRLLGRDTAGAGAGEELTVGGGIEFTGTGGIQTSALTGDVTKSAGSTVTSIANNSLALSKLVNAAAQYDLIGRKSASGGAWEDCTRADLKIAGTDLQNVFTNANGQEIQAGPLTTNLNLKTIDDGADGPFFWMQHDSASPAVGDRVGVLNFVGNDSGGNVTGYAQMRVMIEDPTNGSEDATYRFLTTVAGVSTYRFIVGGGVYSFTATGGDQGVGTANFTAVYDDGVLICAPLHEGKGGAAATQEFWDNIVPNRRFKTPAQFKYDPAVYSKPDKRGRVKMLKPVTARQIAPEKDELQVTKHRTARRHFDMKAEGFDARDPEIYFKRLWSDCAVPGMPTLAEHEQRYPVVNGERVAVDKYSLHERTERSALAMDYMAMTMSAMWDEIKTLRAQLQAVKK